MPFRRSLPAAAALAALAACEPSVPKGQRSTSVDYAVFDLSSSPPRIPLPNNLALASATSLPSGAQRDLLLAFALGGGFPNDQEVPITIDIVRESIAEDGLKTSAPIPPDFATLTTGPGGNLAVIRKVGTSLSFQDVDAPSYSGTTLTIRNKVDAAGTRRWPASPAGPTTYIVAIRGGADGARTADGRPIWPMPTTYFLTQGKDLSLRENYALLDPADVVHAAELGAQLEAVRQAFLPALGVITALAFPADEAAVFLAFDIAPAATHPETDPGAGKMPLPSNFLLDPATGFATVQSISAFGPLAAGIATLDGFSTTAMALLETSAPIQSSTVTSDTVLLYDLGDPANPVRVPDVRDQLLSGGALRAVYLTQPPQISRRPSGADCGPADADCVASAIGLQPAVPVPLPIGGSAFLPPLKEGTTYAVVVTNGVKDTGGAGLVPSTLGKILLFEHPLATSTDPAAAFSLLLGIDGATAAGLEAMRLQLIPVIARAQVDRGVTPDEVALAYTFRTQTISSVSLQLAAAPYSGGGTAFVPLDAASTTAASAFQKYGVQGATGTATDIVPSADIAGVVETHLPTLNALSTETGALDPDPAHWVPAAIPALLAVPSAAAVPTACPTPFEALKCAPLVVFHHGIGGGRAHMLLVANELARKGLVVAAIDAPKHGDRSFCAQASDCTCAGVAGPCTATCTPIGPPGTQGDAVPPGTCSAGSVLTKSPVLCTPLDPACSANATDGVAVASANYFVSANFFRTRDTLRQDVLDHGAMVLALARPPFLPAPPAPDPVAALLAAGFGVAVDPSRVYWAGVSLGGIAGTLNVAANSRVSKAVLNVPGGTLTDVFTQSPAFAPAVDALLASLGISPGTPAYLQFVNVAKWVLDPADPINFAGHLLGDPAHPTLPDLLAGGSPQAGKAVLGQWATNDAVVPNAFNLELFGNLGLLGGTPAGNAVTQFLNLAATPAGTVHHGFLLDYGLSASGQDPNDLALTQIGQQDMAAFLSDGTLPPAQRATP